MKNIIIIIAIVVLVAIGGYFFIKNSPDDRALKNPIQNPEPVEPVAPAPVVDKTKTVIGKSVGGRDIVAYHFGLEAGTGASPTGENTVGTEPLSTAPSREILFVGGIHGGYEWNTALVAYELMDYLKATPTVIPTNVKVTVIPVLNPDGLSKVVDPAKPFVASDITATEEEQIAGRFNGRNVDLNRNFDCDWQATAKWQNKDVSGGSAAFSEPESQAVKSYVETNTPDAVVVWYSAAGGVFASNCHGGVSSETRTLTNTFAKASGYRAYETFDFYEITGDMVNWLAKKDIPAISVLLTNHKDTEWSKNKAGVDALLKFYAK